MSSIHIRRATPIDLQDLQAISIRNFRDTFAASNTEEDMQQYLDKTFNQASLQRELENPDVHFYFALDEEKIAGYLKVNLREAQDEFKDENGIEISRIYADQTYIGKSVGRLLFEKSMSVAKENQSAFIWLGVWENNQRAIRFYEKNGFKVVGKHEFKLGNDLQTDLLMKLQL